MRGNFQIINRKALGYDQWAVYTGVFSNPFHGGTLVSDSKGLVHHCHPWIPAKADHVAALSCELGDLICGIRWTTKKGE